MVRTINAAFREFIMETINLDSAQSDKARRSRNYLLQNIAMLGKVDDSLNLCTKFNLYYGLFARKSH